MTSITSAVVSKSMALANLIGCAAIVIYVAWLCSRGWSLLRKTLSANSAQEILNNVLTKNRFYFRQAVIGFVALAVLAGVKAILIMAGEFSDDAFTAMVFGTAANENLSAMIGWGGVLLALASAICWYQHLKSSHHLQVLYAFRKQLGLTELGI